MTTEFIPAQWLELACWNRPMVVYSRPVELPEHSPAPCVKAEESISLLQAMLADLIER